MSTTSSENLRRQFTRFTRYLKLFAALRNAGTLAATAKPLTFDAYRDAAQVLQGIGVRDVDAHLIPRRCSTRRVYVASWLGFGEWGRAYLRQICSRLDALGLEVVNPWETITEVAPQTAAEAYQIGDHHFRSVSSCSALLLVMDGTEVDGGAISEGAFAWARGLIVNGLRSDPRRVGECPELQVNLMIETFINRSGGAIVPGVDQLAELNWARQDAERSGAEAEAS